MCILVLHGGEGGHEYLCVILAVLVLPQCHVFPLHGMHAVLRDTLVPAEALDLPLQLNAAATARLTALISEGCWMAVMGITPGLSETEYTNQVVCY